MVALKRYIYPEPVNVTLFGKIFADVLKYLETRSS
jgi:hypothetical protein